VVSDQREALARLLHSLKNKYYAECVRGGGIPLRRGVVELMRQGLDRGVRMAITTTTGRANVDALLGTQLGPRWADDFSVVVCGEDVHGKKPDPEVFEVALQRLGLDPLEAVAIEDSPGGVAAARAASVPVIVTRSAYFDDATIEGAIAIGPGLHQREGWRPALRTGAGSPAMVSFDDIESWFAQMDTISQFMS
jgi:beta-phosphoglucomutase-like phosphatase (HAD superfamily)